MNQIIQKLFKLFIKHLWPKIWPIILALVTNVATAVATWLFERFKDFLKTWSRDREDFVKTQESAAQAKAVSARTPEEKAYAEGEAAAWKRVMEKLGPSLDEKFETLRSELESQIGKKIDQMAKPGETEKKFLSFSSPDSINLPLSP